MSFSLFLSSPARSALIVTRKIIFAPGDSLLTIVPLTRAIAFSTSFAAASISITWIMIAGTALSADSAPAIGATNGFAFTVASGAAPVELVLRSSIISRPASSLLKKPRSFSASAVQAFFSAASPVAAGCSAGSEREGAGAAARLSSVGCGGFSYACFMSKALYPGDCGSSLERSEGAADLSSSCFAKTGGWPLPGDCSCNGLDVFREGCVFW